MVIELAEVRMKRIVLYGPPLSGKTTILTAIATTHDAIVETFYAYSSDDDLTCRGVRTQFSQSSWTIEVATLCGPTQTDGIWRTLLRDALAVVLVLDGQREREMANRDWVANLSKKGGHQMIPGCIVVTKHDLPNATFDPAQLGDRFASWPTAETRLGNVTNAIAAIDALVRGL
jgi:signal recognition particle receptor subunit beta